MDDLVNLGNEGSTKPPQVPRGQTSQCQPLKCPPSSFVMTSVFKRFTSTTNQKNCEDGALVCVFS